MDYTTLAIVKSDIQTVQTWDDERLTRAIAAASRAIDRKCTGVPDSDAVDYFKIDARADEVLPGRIGPDGRVLCYPRKPLITTITAFAYRLRPIDVWIDVDPSRCFADGPRVEAFPLSVEDYSVKCQVKISYSGGLAADTADLPADLVEVATLLAVRLYREKETGLQDAIGVAELATGAIYTKAWPTRALDMIQPFVRQVGWRHIA